jgi:hypothetical protein
MTLRSRRCRTVLEVVVDDAVDLREYEIVETGRWPRGTGELTSGWEQLLGPARCRIDYRAPVDNRSPFPDAALKPPS